VWLDIFRRGLNEEGKFWEATPLNKLMGRRGADSTKTSIMREKDFTPTSSLRKLRFKKFEVGKGTLLERGDFQREKKKGGPVSDYSSGE